MLNGLDIEGNSPLHRIPVRGKLILLFAAAIALFLLSDLRLLVPALGLSVALYLSTGIGFVEAVRRTRFVPEIFARYGEIAAAHKARGLPVRPLTLLVPLIILTLKDADTIAMAIDARGFRRH
jgi:biotin transport system permease protein